MALHREGFEARYLSAGESGHESKDSHGLPGLQVFNELSTYYPFFLSYS